MIQLSPEISVYYFKLCIFITDFWHLEAMQLKRLKTIPYLRGCITKMKGNVIKISCLHNIISMFKLLYSSSTIYPFYKNLFTKPYLFTSMFRYLFKLVYKTLHF